MKEINLNVAEVEKRETRLGTIIAWDGNAEELIEQSDYKGRGCGKKNSGCRLCEIEGPFAQGAGCSEEMVECQAGQIRDAVLIQHSPIGCGAGQVGNNRLFRFGLATRNLPIENVKIISTNLLEGDMVFGATKKLKQTVEDATQHGILRQIVNKHPKKQEDLINIITLWGSDVYTPMFKELGLRVNFVVDLASVEDLERLSEAAGTVSFCYTLSSYLSAGLEQHFGVPEIKAPQPYGFKGTDAWLREIGRVTHREELVEKYIVKEHKRVEPIIKELRKKLKGVKGFTSTGSGYSHGLITVLRELGISVDGSLVFHHDPVYDSGNVEADSLKHLVDNYGDVKNFSVSNRQQYQFYSLLKRVNPDFILIKHGGLSPLASKLGISAAPLSDESLTIGYQGMIYLGNKILDILAKKKFHNILKEHTEMQYTDWWLEQSDPYVLAKNPKLLDEKFNELLESRIAVDI